LFLAFLLYGGRAEWLQRDQGLQSLKYLLFDPSQKDFSERFFRALGKYR
jgi:hypothetical protein